MPHGRLLTAGFLWWGRNREGAAGLVRRPTRLGRNLYQPPPCSPSISIRRRQRTGKRATDEIQTSTFLLHPEAAAQHRSTLYRDYYKFHCRWASARLDARPSLLGREQACSADAGPTSGRHVHPFGARESRRRRQGLVGALSWSSCPSEVLPSTGSPIREHVIRVQSADTKQPTGNQDKIIHRSTISKTNVATTRRTRSRNAIQFHHFRLCVSASKLIGMLLIGKGGWCACRSNLLDRNVVALLHLLESQIFTSAACIYRC